MAFDQKVSIIIPFRDQVQLLEKCVFSILEKAAYKNIEIVLVDNNSKEALTAEYLAKIIKNTKIKIIKYEEPFNFSAINNFAVRHIKGEFILFLNNDVEVISENWLGEMLKCFDDESVGVVGAKLLYPNGTIQHAGVMLEEKRLAIHAFRKWKEADVKFDEPREWSAVTGACLMTRKDLFEKVGGFEEDNLPIAYNDVDYCLKIKKLGYLVLCAPRAKLYHYESASRKSDMLAKFFNRKRYSKFLLEQEYMRKNWKREIENDPYYKYEFI